MDDSDFIDNDLPTAAAPTAAGAASSSSAPSATTTSTSVPVVPLPTAGRQGRLRSLLLWRDPRTTGLSLLPAVVFFYLTLVRGLPTLSVFGMFMALHAVLRYIVSYLPRAPHPMFERPARTTPVISRKDLEHYTTLIADEVNEAQDVIRAVQMCDQPIVAVVVVSIGLILYGVGQVASGAAVLLVFTVAAYSLPLAYERNRKAVDDAVHAASAAIAKHVETGRRVAVEQSERVLQRAPPAARKLAGRVGLSVPKSE